MPLKLVRIKNLRILCRAKQFFKIQNIAVAEYDQAAVTNFD